MNPSKAKRTLSILLLAVFVLYAQFSTLEHGVEHLSHDAQELCQVFIGFEKSSSLVSTSIILQTIESDVHYIASNSNDVQLSVYSSYSIRAPPTIV